MLAGQESPNGSPPLALLQGAEGPRGAQQGGCCSVALLVPRRHSAPAAGPAVSDDVSEGTGVLF